MEALKTTQNTFTDDEKGLAERFKVEPKLVRLLDALIERKLSTPEQTDPEQAEPEEQPTEQEQPEELSFDEKTQQRIKAFFRGLDPRAKLAVATLFELQSLDGINFQFRNKDKRLMDEIWSDLESTCIETFHKRKPDEDIPFGINDIEDVFICGIWEGCRMIVHNT